MAIVQKQLSLNNVTYYLTYSDTGYIITDGEDQFIRAIDRTPETYIETEILASIFGPIIVDSYSSTSSNGMSGIAVAEAVSGKANDSEVLHISGNEEVSGLKTFNSTLTTSAININGIASFNDSVGLGSNATSVTPNSSDNSTKVATTAFVKGQGYQVGNLVTTLSVSSTDAQYPSAKCVYDAIVNSSYSANVICDYDAETETLEI